MSIVSQIVQDINDALKTNDTKKAKAVADKIRNLREEDLKDLLEQDICGTTTINKEGRRTVPGDPATFNDMDDEIVSRKVKDIALPSRDTTANVNKPANEVEQNDILVIIGQGILENPYN